MGERERILITVKTYPTLSRKYGETVCTAGVREDGTWVRLYPVPFRRLDQEDRYKKYDWIECRLQRNPSDPRRETFRPIDQNELRPVDHIDTADNWRERRRILLKTARVHDRLDAMIKGAKTTGSAHHIAWIPGPKGPVYYARAGHARCLGGCKSLRQPDGGEG